MSYNKNRKYAIRHISNMINYINGGNLMGLFSSYPEIIEGTCGNCKNFLYPKNRKTEWGECEKYGKADQYDKCCKKHYWAIKSRTEIRYK